MSGTLEAFLSENRGPRPSEQPMPSIDASELDRLAWTPYREGHGAGWIFTDKAPRALTEALEKAPVTLGRFSYKYSGPEEKPKLFISRAPVKE